MPVGANQIWMRQQIREAVAEATQPRQAAAELGRLDHRRELRRQPRPRHADHPLRSVGARRHRGQADSEGRRLREHQRAVLAAGRAAASRPRRSHARRRAQVHPARGLERAGQGLRARARSASASAAIARPATCTRRSSCSARSTTSIRIRGWRSSKRRSWRRVNKLEHRRDGVRRQGHADRLQDRRAQPPAGELLRVGRLRLLGVPPARRASRRARPARSSSWLYRDPGAPDHPDARSGRASRGPAARSRCTRRSPKRRSAR